MMALGISMSPQQKKLLRRFADGKSDKQIAREFGCRAALIAAQRQFMIDRLEISSQAQLAAVAIQLASWPGWQPQGSHNKNADPLTATSLQNGTGRAASQRAQGTPHGTRRATRARSTTKISPSATGQKSNLSTG